MPAFMQVSLLLLGALRLWEGGEAQTQLQQSRPCRTEFSATQQAGAAEQNTCWQQWGFPIQSYSDLWARWEPRLPCQCFLTGVTALPAGSGILLKRVLVNIFQGNGRVGQRANRFISPASPSQAKCHLYMPSFLLFPPSSSL